VSTVANIFSPASAPMDAEQITTLAGHHGLRVERIVSHGHCSPPDFWYDQDEDEWIMVLAGSAILDVNEQQQSLHAGDYLLIPAHCRHRVAWTDPEQDTVWLAVFSSTSMRSGPGSNIAPPLP